MENQIVKISPQGFELPVVDIYLHFIYVLIIFALIKYVFGKFIVKVVNWVKTKWKEIRSKQTIQDWTAVCKVRKEIAQKQDIKPIDLKGQYIQSLSFTVELIGNPRFWRAGFMLGNERQYANKVVDNGNAITIHTGKDLIQKGQIYAIWKYYEKYEEGNPDTSNITVEDKRVFNFSMKINENNHMIVRVNNDVVFARKINPGYRKRLFLKAWADEKPNYKIKFKDIKYTLWS